MSPAILKAMILAALPLPINGSASPDSSLPVQRWIQFQSDYRTAFSAWLDDYRAQSLGESTGGGVPTAPHPACSFAERARGIAESADDADVALAALGWLVRFGRECTDGPAAETRDWAVRTIGRRYVRHPSVEDILPDLAESAGAGGCDDRAGVDLLERIARLHPSPATGLRAAMAAVRAQVIRSRTDCANESDMEDALGLLDGQLSGGVADLPADAVAAATRLVRELDPSRPGYPAPWLRSVAGCWDAVSGSPSRGGPVVVLFFGRWSPPSMRLLRTLPRAFAGADVKLIAVSTDGACGNGDPCAQAAEMGWTCQAISADGLVGCLEAWGVALVPTLFLVDASGVILERSVRAEDPVVDIARWHDRINRDRTARDSP